MGERPQGIRLSLDDPFRTPQDRCRYVACVVPPPGVRLPRPIPSGLSARRLDAGTYVRLDIRSWVQDLQNAYRWFYLVWLSGEGSDWEPIDHPALEQYQEREGEKMIALQFPVRRRRS